MYENFDDLVTSEMNEKLSDKVRTTRSSRKNAIRNIGGTMSLQNYGKL